MAGTLETWKRAGRFVCPRLGHGSHQGTNMRRISRQVSTQVSTQMTDRYALDRQSGQDQTGQCRDSMNNS